MTSYLLICVNDLCAVEEYSYSLLVCGASKKEEEEIHKTGKRLLVGAIIN